VEKEDRTQDDTWIVPAKQIRENPFHDINRDTLSPNPSLSDDR
jgi:hypothetical protein